MIKKIFFSLLILLTLKNIYAEGSGQGQIGFEYRVFKNDNNDDNEDSALSIFSRLENRYEAETWKYVFRGFARVDNYDRDRDLMIIEDAYLRYSFNEEQTFNIGAGYKIFNWSTTEAFHPADSINSKNYDSNLENLEKRGELTTELELIVYDDVYINLFYFPRFENPIFPGPRSRLGTTVAINSPQVIDGTTRVNGNWVPQYGGQLAFTAYNFDVAIHALSQINRLFPLLGTTDYTYNSVLNTYLPNDSNSLTKYPTPYYFRNTQYGLTLQGILGPFLVKLEGAVRDFDNETSVLTLLGLRKAVDHQEAALGFEYSYNHERFGQTFFFLEFNSIFGTDEITRAEISVFQRDMFLGMRHSFDDVMAKEFTIGLFNDIERSNERLYTFSYAQRLTDEWKFTGGIRYYDAPKKETIARGLEAYDEDHHLYINILRFF